ncbi:polycystic kidney disease 2-like 2 protein, partial [Zootermopsis nevadensis]|uniref:polycystic kidney disease 2-like 2 protein n=1 Tax=Zootermopsis nevadensis TaxID=136037 RepID=UPI000B8E65C0
MKLVFEIPPTGGIITSSFYSIVKLHHYVTKFDSMVAFFECTFIAFIFFYTIAETVKIVVLKRKYRHSIWNFFDLAILVLAYVVICFRIYSYVAIEPQIVQLIAEEKSANFDSVVSYQLMYNNVIAFLAALTWLKIFKYTRFNKTMSQFSMTFAKCYKQIVAFSIMFFIVFATFAQLGYLLFGKQVEDFRALLTTVSTLARATIGDFDLNAVEVDHPILARLFYISYLFVVFFIMMNMFLAIVTDAYAFVRCEEAMKDSFKKSHFKNDLEKLMSKLG